MSGLAEATGYEFRAVVSTSDGDSDAGTTRTFMTTGDPTVTTGDADPDVGSVTFHGTLSDIAGADSAAVYFEHRESTALGTGDWQSSGTETLTSEGSFSITVSDLLSGTTYEYRAVADTPDGDSERGEIREVTTLT